MMNRDVTIVDYGMGNIWSVASALHFLKANVRTSADPEKILTANRILLPGVGSYRRAMAELRDRGLDEALREAVLQKGRPILGICLGMQILGERGTEDGETAGLGLIGNRVEKFNAEPACLKVPHIGFNTVSIENPTGFFRGMNKKADFYFVHSYRMLPEGLSGNLATCEYGNEFLAAFQVGNIMGTQFHPEKSQTNGLALLKNFLEI